MKKNPNYMNFINISLVQTKILCIVAIGNPERHVRKASHRGSKQTIEIMLAISLRVC